MKRREFFGVLSSAAAAWIAAAFLLIGGVLHNSAAAQAEDIAYCKIGWWQIKYRELEDMNGCYAASLFRQTLLHMALAQTDKGKAWFIFISNPAWDSWIKRKKQHTLIFVTTKPWQGTFFVSSGTTELSSTNLSIEFMNSIADAKSIEIYDENKRLLISLDMKDSANAIKSVVNCVRDHPLPTGEAKTPPEAAPQVETTISGTGFFVAPNFFVTNSHVVNGCRQGIYVQYPDQNSYAAGISGQDSANDLARIIHGGVDFLEVSGD